MKNYFLLLLFAIIGFACSNHKSNDKIIRLFLSDATEKAKNDNKTLVIEFWAPECGPCIRLKRDVFENEGAKKLISDNFYLVQVSPADSIYKPLWNHFHLDYQSTIIFMNKNGIEIDRTVSYDGNRDYYLSFLKDVTDGKNLFIDVYSAYQRDSLEIKNNYLLATKLLFRYQLKDAIKLYNKVLMIDPENKSGFNYECKYKIAESQLMLNGDLSKMKDYLKEDPLSKFAPKAYEYVINDLINKKDTSNCISLCQEAIDKHPDSWEILNKFAWAICTFKQEQDYKKALIMVQKSIELNPFRSGTYSTEAWIHFKMGNKEKAIELQNKAIEIYPNQAYIQDLEKFKSN
jgi:thioredoxin-related protein